MNYRAFVIVLLSSLFIMSSSGPGPDGLFCTATVNHMKSLIGLFSWNIGDHSCPN